MHHVFFPTLIKPFIVIAFWVAFNEAFETGRSGLESMALAADGVPAPFMQAKHVLTLTRHHDASRSESNPLSLRKMDEVDGARHNASLTSALKGQLYLADITFGTKTFQVAVDTGSSDAWLIGKNFQCINVTTGIKEPQGNCGFGPPYTPSPTFRQIQNQVRNITYGGGESVAGTVGREVVTFAGITVTDQEVAVVDSAVWHGDGVSSGLIGLALPATRSQSAETNTEKNATQMVYTPIITNMFAQGITPQIFSLAIDRSAVPSNGGILAIGGLPVGYEEANFTTTPFRQSSTSQGYHSYIITISGFTYRVDYRTAEPQPEMASSDGPTTNNSVVDAIVDSGTTFIKAPTAIANAVNALFDPPATYSVDRGIYLVNCSAKPPYLGINIASTTFSINSEDLILAAGQGDCMSGVNDAGNRDSILGDVFLKNVLAVFDIGAREMRFAAREDH
ncbi:hypothetical protein ACLMJK_002963 [Lecanora helva]